MSSIPTLREGEVTIRPIRVRDARALERELIANRRWLRPWEATNPHGPLSFDTRAGIRSLLSNARAGSGLPFAVELEGDAEGRVRAVNLEDGRRLAADCVVIAAGITPNAELGRAAGLEVDRAIVVDAHLTASDPAIHALGECCQFRGTTYGLVEPIWRQVEVLADHLCRDKDAAPVAGYVERPAATKLKISGVSLYAFGPIEPEDDHEVLCYHDPQQGDYRRLLLRNNRLEGAVLYGDTAAGPWYFEQSLAGQDLSAGRQALLFGAGDAVPLLENAPSNNATQEAAA